MSELHRGLSLARAFHRVAIGSDGKPVAFDINHGDGYAQSVTDALNLSGSGATTRELSPEEEVTITLHRGGSRTFIHTTDGNGHGMRRVK